VGLSSILKLQRGYGWLFAGGAGLDYDKGLGHSGKGNGWVRNTSGWNSIKNQANVEPRMQRDSVVRTSETLTDGYVSTLLHQ